MDHEPRTLADINAKIENGTAIILTASELLGMSRSEEPLPDVDVVTCATKGIMSGTMLCLSFKVAEKNEFVRPQGIWINGVPAYPGPCPNERLGIVDCIVYGTAHSITKERYGGGHLFRDLAERSDVQVVVSTESGNMITTTLTLDDMSYATMYATRNAFKNYLAYVNPSSETLERSIFSIGPFYGPYKEMKFCGCGELNPVEKDPGLDVIGKGTNVLINGAPGMVTGAGTRSTKEKPNLSAVADLKLMSPEYLGGFNTSEGPEVIMTWAIPIPVFNGRVLKNLLKTDDAIPLPVVDVRGRQELGRITYADVWQGCDLAIKLDEKKCEDCKECAAEAACPTGALSFANKRINRHRCFNCGMCVGLCQGHAISANMGTVEFNGIRMPITERHSDRLGAMRISAELKRKILSGEFRLSEMVDRINL